MPGILHALMLSAVAVASGVTVQVPNTPQPSGPAKPQRDPVTVRGCMDGRFLRIVEHDVAQLSGVTRVRLIGRRGVLASLRDQSDGKRAYVEVTGQIDVPATDRVETRMKRKVGSRSTIAVGSAAERDRPVAPPPATLSVEAFAVLGPTCPVG